MDTKLRNFSKLSNILSIKSSLNINLIDFFHILIWTSAQHNVIICSYKLVKICA